MHDRQQPPARRVTRALVALAAVGFPIGCAFAQLGGSIDCLNDPACLLQQQSGSIVELIEQNAAADAPAKTFLVNLRRELKGIPPLATDARLVDYGVNQIEGNPYWDAYGTGAFFEAAASNALGMQIWHVNFASKVRRQITDGTCITGIGTFRSNWRCAYQSPIAASPAGDLAFIQQVVAAPTAPPETPHWQVAIASGSVARIVVVHSSRPRSMSWSPDGEWLLVPDGRDLTAISKTSGRICDYPNVSSRAIEFVDWGDRNGGEVVYANAGNLWLLSLRPPPRPTRCPTSRIQNQEQLTNTDHQDNRPQWLEPSGLIGFVSNRPVSGGANTNLWAINPDNPAPVAFAVLSFEITHADWQRASESADRARIRNSVR